jgi:RNA polymerase sigma-70 factor (ECF subfamily)
LVESDPSLVPLFLPHLAQGWQEHAVAAGPALEETLERLMERTPAELNPDPTDFLAHVARRLPEPNPGWDDGDLLRLLARIRVEDLALAWACARDEPDAVAELERQHFHVVDAALGQIAGAAAQAEEIKQLLRQRLFVPPTEGDEPRIAQYSGRGDLRSWLRVAAIRCAINHLQKQGREVALGDEMLAHLAAPDPDQELDLFKRRYRAEFKRAFEGALRQLSSRDRNLLRYHYLERLNIDQIGAIYSVHRTTVARWLARTREGLLAQTRRSLMAQLRIERTEFESIMRLIESQLDASIARFLDTIPPDPETR